MLECPQCHGAGFFSAQTPFGLSGFCTRCSGLGKVHLRSLAVGEHACYFYDSQQNCLETVVSFLAEGLHRKNQCLLVTADHLKAPEVLKTLHRLNFDVAHELERGALQVVQHEQIYANQGPFDSKSILEFFKTLSEQSVQKGFTCFRVVAEASQKMSSIEECERLVEYEFSIDNFFLKEKPAITAMCMYDLRHFPAPLLEEMRLAHRVLLQD